MAHGLSAPLLLLALLLLLPVGLCAAGEEESYRVNWVYDGDSIRLEGLGKVRLLGIDSPEKEASERDAYYQRRAQISPQTLRRVARQALDFNRRLLEGAQVRLQFDHQRTDRYGRTLAYVLLPDGRMLNRLLLEEGLAACYRRFDFRLKEEFLRIEESARARQRGIWQK